MNENVKISQLCYHPFTNQQEIHIISLRKKKGGKQVTKWENCTKNPFTKSRESIIDQL